MSRLPSGGPGNPAACEAIAKQMAIAAVGLSMRWGWPDTLDGLLSAYVTLAVEKTGPAQVAEVLTELAEALLKAHAGG